MEFSTRASAWGIASDWDFPGFASGFYLQAYCACVASVSGLESFTAAILLTLSRLGNLGFFGDQGLCRGSSLLVIVSS